MEKWELKKGTDQFFKFQGKYLTLFNSYKKTKDMVLYPIVC